MTSFNPDHTSSTAHTFMSTRPSGRARSRTTSSVMSVATPELLLGHETQIIPSGAILARWDRSLAFSLDARVAKACTNSMPVFDLGSHATSTSAGRASMAGYPPGAPSRRAVIPAL